MKKQRGAAEWIGGIVALPGYVTGEGAPYRPEALFWTDATGLVLGQLIGPPGGPLGEAADSLRRTIVSDRCYRASIRWGVSERERGAWWRAIRVPTRR